MEQLKKDLEGCQASSGGEGGDGADNVGGEEGGENGGNDGGSGTGLIDAVCECSPSYEMFEETNLPWYADKHHLHQVLDMMKTSSAIRVDDGSCTVTDV